MFFLIRLYLCIYHVLTIISTFIYCNYYVSIITNKANKDVLVEEFYVNVQKCGNSAHIRLSKRWLGKRVRMRVEENENNR